MAKKGPPLGTVNNPKGINQYTSKGPSNGRTNNRNQLKANPNVRAVMAGLIKGQLDAGLPVHRNVKAYVGMSTSGPAQRSIVGAKRVLEQSGAKYQKAFDVSTGNPWEGKDIKDLPKKGVTKTLKDVRTREKKNEELLKKARHDYMNADDKFMNYRIQTKGSPVATAEANSIYRRARKNKQ
jgi:hypothetical protein